MSLTLTSDDIRRLNQSLQVLLSPLDHPTFDSWRGSVCHTLKELLGMQRSMFWAGVPGEAPLFSGEGLDDAVREYVGYYSALDDGAEAWQLAGCPRIYTAERLQAVWPDGHTVFLKSEIFNDWYSKYQMLSTVGIQDAELPGVLFSRGLSLVGVGLYGVEEQTEPLEEWRAQLLRLLFPAFHAGVRTWIQLGAARTSLGKYIDRLADGLLVCDSQGRVLHSNAALSRILSTDVEAEKLRMKLDEVSRGLQEVAASRNKASRSVPVTINIDVMTMSGAYRVRGSVESCSIFGPGTCCLILVESVNPRLCSGSEMMERFGLTVREATVAGLLAQGHSNVEIAARLHLSGHTVRHHVEKILLKLGVRSRAAIRSALLQRVPTELPPLISSPESAG